MDFIFGTLATDELRLAHHIASQRGIQHGSAIFPRDPKPGEAVTVEATTGGDFPADHVVLYYTADGSTPVGQRGVSTYGDAIMMTRGETEWDSLSWSYVTHWQAVLPPQPEGVVVTYLIGAWGEDTPEVFADYPHPTQTVEAAADAFFNHRPAPDKVFGDPSGEVFSYRVDTLKTPNWARDAVIYQIFVDRFYPGGGQGWLQTEDLRAFCGGTLWGAAEKLDYLLALGIKCVWLSPIWIAPSHHGYDVTDYTRVEPRLGGDAALRAFVESAHMRGIRVLLDLVCNHISNQHPIFQEALNNPGSPCRDWFTFDESPTGYRTFFGVSTMPQVNLSNPGAKAWMIDIARYWLEKFDVDGYRLDYANGPTSSFWWDFRTACRDAKQDCLLFGEVVDAPDVVRTYQGKLDGCLDFYSAQAIRQAYGWKTLPETRLKTHIAGQADYFPGDFVMPTFIDNHDMDRFLYIANGDKDALRQAAKVQMSLPNPPIIYYGTEVGCTQSGSVRDGKGLHVSRVPMLWDGDQDTSLLEFYKDLIRARSSH